ncbi:beta-ketoacyl synthase N-terminal-like domain-containing protein [Abyssalbus ytuae]|uniref:Beta-ketoacyl synthase n=1 Tax=Abyssalbus ytuae TaxID=2926907 RepID=A0A9E6ZRB7_9FLAO|nr:beta-ketoacyl synthase N-terminal-like domain-containing protein [Abyssalbus ytuae]UOB19489.1 beta-ketoacyl synthase [Abyssalbus ytuae]
MKEELSIASIGSVSPLGISQERIWENYKKNKHFITEKNFTKLTALVSELDIEAQNEIDAIKCSDNKYKDLDSSVLYAICASRIALKKAGWEKESDFGINIGSSRGATSLFEKYHKDFLETGISSTLTSPTTTLGNISSWVAQDLKTKGPEISHSITCSTALHALLNGVAWLQSGMTDKFIVGGSEAPLTPFTIAQMKAMKIYAKSGTDTDRQTFKKNEYPCRAFDLEKSKNTMVLGEGACVVCLEKGVNANSVAVIEGVGFATEMLTHNVSISANAECFQKSMKMALGNLEPDQVDVIVMHAPGTIKGDSSEVNAVNAVFKDSPPFLTTNKWKIGHTFGASGMLSLEFALLMLKNQNFIGVPYVAYSTVPSKIERVMINAVGFGGNAVSILIKNVNNHV